MTGAGADNAIRQGWTVGNDDDRNRPRPHPTPGPRRRDPDPKGSVPPWLIYVLVLVVAGAWLAAFIVGLFNPKYQVPPEVNGLFTGLMGVLFFNAASKRKGGDDE